MCEDSRKNTLVNTMIAEKEIPIRVDKDILSGTPVFEGTRVPVSALLDNLEVGVSLDEFLENFPTVTREQAIQVLEYFKSSLDDFEKAA
jgi:uncharacterized protein (DUF433 family)